jgi:predicted phage tail component-like protein
MPSVQGLQGFVFRGKHSSEYGIIVNKVHPSLIAPLTPKLVSVPSRAGAHYFGKEMGVREFRVDITIVGTSQSDLFTKARDIAQWLYNDENEESELIFDQEPDKSYFAFLSGDTNLESLVTIGQTTLQFICPDPYAYGPEVETPAYTYSPMFLTVGGKEPTYPIYHVKFIYPSSYFAITNKENYIHIGRHSIDLTVKANQKMINDGMSTTATWTPHATVDGGSVTGSFYSNGYSFQVQTYGTGSAWHGPCLKKMIQDPIQDFTCEAIIGMYAKEQKQLGRVEIYLLDVNSNVIGKMALADPSGYEVSRFEARAGALSGGKYFAVYEGKIEKKKKKVPVTKKVKGKNVTSYQWITEEYSTFRDFFGLIKIARRGNKWSAYIEKRDPKSGKAIASKSFYFTDKNNQYMQRVAGVAVHIGQYGNNPFMSPAYISHITLTNLVAIGSDEALEIFDAGDELIIDTEEGAVYLNGSPFMEHLNIGSDFFPLIPNVENELRYEPDEACEVTVSYRPRYL